MPDPPPEQVVTGADLATRWRRRTRRADAAIEQVVDRWRSPALDRVFYPLSSAADHSLLWLAAGAWRSAREGDERFALRLAGALGVESFVTNVVVKSAFRRHRPAREVPDGPLPYGLHVPVTSAFPSGHATAAFTAAAFLGRDRRTRLAWYTLATLVATSRVYVRLHHPSDVVAGAALGAAFGAVLTRLLDH